MWHLFLSKKKNIVHLKAVMHLQHIYKLLIIYKWLMYKHHYLRCVWYTMKNYNTQFSFCMPVNPYSLLQRSHRCQSSLLMFPHRNSWEYEKCEWLKDLFVVGTYILPSSSIYRTNALCCVIILTTKL